MAAVVAAIIAAPSPCGVVAAVRNVAAAVAAKSAAVVACDRCRILDLIHHNARCPVAASDAVAAWCGRDTRRTCRTGGRVAAAGAGGEPGKQGIVAVAAVGCWAVAAGVEVAAPDSVAS